MEEKESILIVDDDKSTRDILSLTFRRKGYETVTVASGAEAKEKLGERFFNVALVDIRLPDMQGTDLLGPINEMHPEMAVVLITGFSSLETALQALDEGAAAYLTKPLGMDDILPRIEELLEKQRLVRARAQSEQRYRSLFENTREAIVITDSRGNISSVNPYGVSMLGYDDAEEILGRPAVDFYAEQSLRGELYKELMETGFSTGKELMLRKKDGSEIWVSVFATLHTDDDRESLRTESFFRDVTERKLAELRLRELVYRLNGVSPGHCYLVESRENCMKIFADLVFHGVPGLCLTRDDPESLMSQYGLDRDSLVLVSSRPLEGFRHAANLQSVSLEISQFIKENGSVIVVLDGLTYLISRSGFDAFFNFVQDKKFDFIDEKGVLLIPLDPATLSEQQIALLKSEIPFHSETQPPS